MNEDYKTVEEFESNSGTPSNEFDETTQYQRNQTAIASSEEHAEQARKWASEDVDVEVYNSLFSALHYATKSAENLDSIIIIKNDIAQQTSVDTNNIELIVTKDGSTSGIKSADISKVVFFTDNSETERKTRSGIFEWRTGNYSDEITMDTFEAIWIKADGVASTEGAWVRRGYETGKAYIEWGGANGDYINLNNSANATDNSPILTKFIEMASKKFLPSRTIGIGPGDFQFNSTVEYNSFNGSNEMDNVRIIGSGATKGNRTADKALTRFVYAGDWGKNTIHISPDAVRAIHNIVISDIEFFGGGIRIEDQVLVTEISRCSFRYCFKGIVYDGPNYSAKITDCWFWGFQDVPITIDDCNDLYIDYCGFSNAGLGIAENPPSLGPNRVFQPASRIEAGILIGKETNCILINISRCDIEMDFLDVDIKVVRGYSININGHYYENRGTAEGLAEFNVANSPSDIDSVDWVKSGDRIRVVSNQFNNSKGQGIMDGLIPSIDASTHQFTQQMDVSARINENISVDFEYRPEANSVIRVILTSGVFSSEEQRVDIDFENRIITSQLGNIKGLLDEIEPGLFHVRLIAYASDEDNDFLFILRLRGVSFPGDNTTIDGYISDINIGLSSATYSRAFCEIGDQSQTSGFPSVTISDCFIQGHGGTYQEAPHNQLCDGVILNSGSVQLTNNHLRRWRYNLVVNDTDESKIDFCSYRGNTDFTNTDIPVHAKVFGLTNKVNPVSEF